MTADMIRLTRSRIYRRHSEIASRSLVKGSSSAYEGALLVELIGKSAIDSYRAESQRKLQSWSPRCKRWRFRAESWSRCPSLRG
jgi:hypothetical protein